MRILQASFALGAVLVALSGPTLTANAESGGASASAQPADPSGQFKDKFGTAFKFALCGGGTDLCGVLLDVQGKSRTDENLAYVNKQVLKAAQSAPNEWKGTVMFDGSEASATITQTGPDSIEVQGCKAAVLCQTLVFTRV
ncbi:hypothetical protein [Devosia sp.]|uniref:hypothetical protein n=1 Tax=Devosia sp. TaxID=1871048 RepID=UPI00326603A0